MKAVCSGCGLSGDPFSSSVTIGLPCASATLVWQERAAAPLIKTVHAPHWRKSAAELRHHTSDSRSTYEQGFVSIGSVDALCIAIDAKIVLGHFTAPVI